MFRTASDDFTLTERKCQIFMRQVIYLGKIIRIFELNKDVCVYKIPFLFILLTLIINQS